jgi:hypothetical protein
MVIYLLQAGGSYYGDNGVYEAISINADGTNNAGFSGKAPAGNNIVPANPPASALANTAAALEWLSQYYWIQVQPNFIGANERASYSCQKTIYEYALNKWFNTTFRQPGSSPSDIYISNNNLVPGQFFFAPSTPARQGSFFEQATDLSGGTFFSQGSSSTPQYDFSINIPVAAYNALDDEMAVAAGSNTTDRDAIVSAFANLLNPAGATYNIITY